MTILTGYSLPTLYNETYFKYWGENRYPYPHQVKVLEMWNKMDENGCEAFLVESPTGSGKTVTAAFPAAHFDESSIFVYPTNALLEDQAESLGRMLSDMGKKVYIIDGSDYWIPQEVSDAEVVIVVLNGDTLTAMQKKFKVRSKGEALNKCIVKGKKTFIVTNSDTLYLLASYRYGQSSHIFSKLVQFQNLIIDEFHLYDGMELAHLLFLLYYYRNEKLYSRLLMLSATPNNKVYEYITKLFNITKITADLNQHPKSVRIMDQREVVQNLDFRTVHCSSTFDSVPEILQLVQGLWQAIKEEPLYSNKEPAPLVIIVYSPIEAMAIERYLLQILKLPIGELASYRGLIGREARKMKGKRVIVGTTALEVGIDFHCQRLIFTARSFDAFIQRLGRAGRHALTEIGEVYFLYDRHSALDQINMLEKNNRMNRDELKERVREIFPLKESMALFASSNEGLWSSFSCLWNQMNIVSSDSYVTREERLMFKKILLGIYITYLDALQIEEDVKKISINHAKWFLREDAAKDERSWHSVYFKTAMFRPSNFRIEVVNSEDKRLGRSDFESFSATLKQVLERGRGVKPTKMKSNGVMSFSVNHFGGKFSVNVVLANQYVESINRIIVIGINNNMTFRYGKKTLTLESMKLKKPVIAYVTQKERLREIDWRIEWWEVGENDAIAFGSYALLLKWWIESNT